MDIDATRISIPGAESSIVVYFTSLRVVQPTFEDCRAVTAILRTFTVRARSLDGRVFRGGAGADLRREEGSSDEAATCVYLRTARRGAEEVTQLHEMGELKKLVQELPRVAPGVCEMCGGYRFVPCNDCHGSHKVYTEKLGFRIRSTCNKNGLVRCSCCSYSHLRPRS